MGLLPVKPVFLSLDPCCGKAPRKASRDKKVMSRLSCLAFWNSPAVSLNLHNQVRVHISQIPRQGFDICGEEIWGGWTDMSLSITNQHIQQLKDEGHISGPLVIKWEGALSQGTTLRGERYLIMLITASKPNTTETKPPKFQAGIRNLIAPNIPTSSITSSYAGRRVLTPLPS